MTIKTILVAVDGSKQATKATEFAADLAQRCGASHSVSRCALPCCLLRCPNAGPQQARRSIARSRRKAGTTSRRGPKGRPGSPASSLDTKTATPAMPGSALLRPC